MTSHFTKVGNKRGMPRAAILFLALVSLGTLAWLIQDSQRGGREQDGRANPAKPAPSLGADRTRAWKTNGGPGQHPDRPESGNDPAPSEQTPVLDAWMEKNWSEDDAIVIDGLITFAARDDLGLAEKSKALEHALNLLPDTDYQKLDPLLTDEKASAHLLQQVFSDMHNRSEKALMHAGLLLIKRSEPEVVDAAKGLLAHWLDLDEENELEVIRLQGETRLIELQEEEPPPPDLLTLDPSAPLPPGVRDASLPAPEE